MENVYVGTGMDRVERGIGEVPAGRRIAGETILDPAELGRRHRGQQAPGMGWDDFNNKRILGDVPVEADGGRRTWKLARRPVRVSPGRLDEKKMMVQSMRSGTMVRPGETAGCGGCARGEPRRCFPRRRRRRCRAAVHRGRLEPWYGPSAGLQLPRARCSRSSTGIACVATTTAENPARRS